MKYTLVIQRFHSHRYQTTQGNVSRQSKKQKLFHFPNKLSKQELVKRFQIPSESQISRRISPHEFRGNLENLEFSDPKSGKLV